MKKSTIPFLALLLIALSLTSCSKKGADRMLGKWKVDKIKEMEDAGIKMEMFYEFTKDKIILHSSVIQKLQQYDTVINRPKIVLPYVIKSDEGASVTFDATNPFTSEKGEFTLKFTDDNSIQMIDPNKREWKLIKN